MNDAAADPVLRSLLDPGDPDWSVVERGLEDLARELRATLARGDHLPELSAEGWHRHLGGAFPGPDVPAPPEAPVATQPLPAPSDFVAMLLRAETERDDDRGQ